MTECKIDHSDYRNNGLITKIWGGPGWIFNHSVSFGYPLEPTEKQKEAYKNYFLLLGDVLPCKYCRESYQKFITTGKTAMTPEVLESRYTLTKWLYDVHEAVNGKLEMDYGVTYEDVVSKYESFRAKCGKPNKTEKGCVAPLDYKAFSFKKLYHKDAPIIPLKSIMPFVVVAKIRGLDDRFFEFTRLAMSYDGNFTELKKHPIWDERNMICQKQIQNMRESAIPSIEDSGPWKGTPTISELVLLMYLSTNLNRSEIKTAIENLLKNPLFIYSDV